MGGRKLDIVSRERNICDVEIEIVKLVVKGSTNMKRDFYLDEYTILKSDLINNMDHMRIWGTEPSSVILSQAK